MTNKTEMVSVPRELLESALAVVARQCTSNWSARIKDGLEEALAAPAEDVRAVGEEPVAWELSLDGVQKELTGRQFGAGPAWKNLTKHGYVISALYRHPPRPVADLKRFDWDRDGGMVEDSTGEYVLWSDIERLNK